MRYRVSIWHTSRHEVLHNADTIGDAAENAAQLVMRYNVAATILDTFTGETWEMNPSDTFATRTHAAR